MVGIRPLQAILVSALSCSIPISSSNWFSVSGMLEQPDSESTATMVVAVSVKIYGNVTLAWRQIRGNGL